MTVTSIELYRTTTGQRQDIAECPHVLGAVLIAVTSDDTVEREVCRWCAAELAEEGRTYHDTIEAALLDMGAPRQVIAELTAHLRTAEHDTVFVPHSRSYVALALAGRSVAWAGCTYVGFRGGRRVLLPDYAPGGGGPEVARAWGEVCTGCWTARSLAGFCGCG